MCKPRVRVAVTLAGERGTRIVPKLSSNEIICLQALRLYAFPCFTTQIFDIRDRTNGLNIDVPIVCV